MYIATGIRTFSRVRPLHTTAIVRKVSPSTASAAAEAAAIRSDPTLPGQTLTLFQKLKGFASFYKSGLKELVANMRAAPEIQKRLAQKQQSSIADLVSRHEWQIAQRTPKDKLRLIPFGFLVVCIPELIPLTIWLFPNVCPTTCLTYGQVAKMAQKHDDKVKLPIHVQALERSRALGISVDDCGTEKGLLRTQPVLGDIGQWESQDVSLANRYMGLGGGSTKRLLDHLDYLSVDDQLIAKEALVSQLGLAELIRACQERGIPTAGYPESHLRRALDSWMQLTQKKGKELQAAIVWSRMALHQKSTK